MFLECAATRSAPPPELLDCPAKPSRVQRRMEAPHAFDFLLPAARPCNVIVGLHLHQRIHFDAERLFDPQGHAAGQVGLAV